MNENLCTVDESDDLVTETSLHLGVVLEGLNQMTFLPLY